MNAKDAIGREISVGDFVYSHNYLYEVVEVGAARTSGGGDVKIILIDKSPTTRPVKRNSREMAILSKDDVLLWMIKGRQ